MKSLVKEYDYTPERWRKAGRLLDEAGRHFDGKADALHHFSEQVKALFNGNDTFSATLSSTDSEQLWIEHPRTGVCRVLSIQFDEYHGYSVAFMDC